MKVPLLDVKAQNAPLRAALLEAMAVKPEHVP
jgi:hypothetical protein